MRQVLSFLADEGPVESPNGLASRLIAAAIDCSPGQTSTLLGKMDDDGLIDRHRHSGSGRCFRISITAAGRDVLGRGKHRAVAPRPTCPAPVRPAFPVLGPIGHLDFDPDVVRDQQAEVSV